MILLLNVLVHEKRAFTLSVKKLNDFITKCFGARKTSVYNLVSIVRKMMHHINHSSVKIPSHTEFT